MIWYEYDNIEGELSSTLVQLAAEEARLLETQRSIGLLKSHADRLRKHLPTVEGGTGIIVEFGEPEPSSMFHYQAQDGNIFYLESRMGWTYMSPGMTGIYAWVALPEKLFPMRQLHPFNIRRDTK